MGRVSLRGRARPVDLFEPAPDFPAGERALLAQALQISDSDPAQALAIVAGLVERNAADKALNNLLVRMQALNEEGSYVLD